MEINKKFLKKIIFCNLIAFHRIVKSLIFICFFKTILLHHINNNNILLEKLNIDTIDHGRIFFISLMIFIIILQLLFKFLAKKLFKDTRKILTNKIIILSLVIELILLYSFLYLLFERYLIYILLTVTIMTIFVKLFKFDFKNYFVQLGFVLFTILTFVNNLFVNNIFIILIILVILRLILRNCDNFLNIKKLNYNKFTRF